MEKHESLSSAKAVLALLILFIAFVVFYKFVANQDYFFGDPEMLRNYVMFAIIGGGFLVGLLYLASQTKHPGSSKATKKKKKK
ncbi:MAG TPA: hypothetical protein VLF89_09820 [Candidatus Saccharimonadales bacterium]|nr:hypothetical protein [Candidatus Saccharimonadales bacterium]